MKFIDMFCGIGTIRMGMEQAGHECVYSIEWDKHKKKIYKIIFGGEPDATDIRAVSGGGLPRADCWCFGAPCQDFSIAGKREGLEGDRSSMVREVFRLLREIEEEHRPKYLLYENVKGMLSSNKGFDFLEILAEMESLGYDRIEYSLLNSKNFGVPQNRERVFTVGHLRGRSTGKVFPIPGENKTNPTGLFQGEGIAYCLDSNYWKGVNRFSRCRTRTLVESCNLEEQNDIKVIQVGNFMATKNRENPNQGRVYDSNGISPTLNKMEGGGRQPHIVVRACLTPDRLEKRQNGRRFKEEGEPMFTLTKQDIHGVMIDNTNEVKCINSKDENGKQPPQQARVYDTDGVMKALQAEQGGRFNIMIKEATKKGYTEAAEGDSINLAVPGSQTRRGRVGKGVANTLDTSCNQGTLIRGRIRRLTPKECWRLQGIPDSITDKVITAGISDTQMYRGAGDACTVNVIYEIATRMS